MRKFSTCRRICFVSLLCALVSMMASPTVSPAQTFEPLFQIDDGVYPIGPLVQGTDGNLYGVTQDGGTSTETGCCNGTVFKITTSGMLTTLDTFLNPNGGIGGPENPSSALIQASDGNFYGTSLGGGVGWGTVFKVTPDGTVTVLYSFCNMCTDEVNGSFPQTPLVQGTDGNFYGTTQSGGNTDDNCPYIQGLSPGCGTIFKITPIGTLTTLYTFCLQANCPDGRYPQAGLIQGSDGNFYGTMANGGDLTCQASFGCGYAFRISSDGTMTKIHNFETADGIGPTQPLVQATNGNFYGTTQFGGANNFGTIFEMSPSGTVTVLHSFCAQPSCADGSAPSSPLIQARDGNFYGTTLNGGSTNCNNGVTVVGCGTIFKVSPTGTFTTLYTFCSQISSCPDGKNPTGGVIQATDGNLYGTTTAGGVGCNAGCGTVFTVSLAPLTATSTTLISSLDPSNYGQAVTFTATVTPKSGSATPTRTVNFFDGSTNLGSSTLNSSGVATLAISTLSGGTHSMTAGYNGDATFAPSTSAVLSEVVRGQTAVLSPSSLTFNSPGIGTTPPSQTVTLTNTGTATLTVNSISITGANASEFFETNDCPGSVTAGGSCAINVTFEPAGSGTAQAALIVADNAPGSPQTAGLAAIVGTGSGVSLSPTTFTFPNQYVGTSGPAQILTVTNSGNAVLTISSVTSSVADFSAHSNCTNPVQPGANCTVSVFFDPTAGGTRNGTLLISDNATGSPQSVTLSGIGEDFSVASSGSSTSTISAGQTATYTIAIAPAGGFNQTVTLACSGAPVQSTCALSQNSVVLNGSQAAAVTVTVTTAGNSAKLLHPGAHPLSGNTLAFWLGFCGLPALVLVGTGWRRLHSMRLLRRIGLLLVLCFAVLWVSCGGGSNSGTGGGSGTPAGTYNLTVTATFVVGSHTLTHDAKLTLVVQ